VYAHLWVGDPVPYQYFEAKLCERYHCPPSVIQEQDLRTVQDHITCWNAEARVEADRQRMKR
jgi:hypothetical protein